MKRLPLSAGFLLAVACSAAWAQTGPNPPAPGPGAGAGWSLMTPAERAEHQSKLASFTRYDECVGYVNEHHKLMQQRAKERNVTIPEAPRRDVCAHLKAGGSSN